MTAIGDIVQYEDLPALSRVLSGVGVAMPPGDLEAVDVLREDLRKLDRKKWESKLGRMLAARLAALGVLPRAWVTLEEEEAWNAVVLAGELADGDEDVMNAVLKVEEHVQAFPPTQRRDFVAQIDRALTRCQSGSRLLARWRKVLVSSLDPVALFRAFVGLIWARDRELSASENEPLALIREGLVSFERQIGERPDRDRWLTQALISIQATYPASAGQWATRLHDIVSKWSPAARASLETMPVQKTPPANAEKAEGRPKRRMSKADLIKLLTDESADKLTRKEVKGVLDTLALVGKRELKKTGIFLVPGFGKFVTVKKAGSKELAKKAARRASSSHGGKAAT